MAGDLTLPPWLAQSNTDLMPRAMAAGAQVGSIIAQNIRAKQDAEREAQLFKQKQVQEAMRYQGFQDYQRDIASGIDAGEAIKKHGAKMYFGQTVFPEMLNTMQRNADLQRYHDTYNTIRQQQANERSIHNQAQEIWNAEKNRLTKERDEAKQPQMSAEFVKLTEADQQRKLASELSASGAFQQAEEALRKAKILDAAAEVATQRETRLKATADLGDELKKLKIKSEKENPGDHKRYLAIEGAIERAVAAGKMTEEEGVKVLRANLGADPKQRAEITRNTYITTRLPRIIESDEDNLRKRSLEARIKQASDEWDKIKESTQPAAPIPSLPSKATAKPTSDEKVYDFDPDTNSFK